MHKDELKRLSKKLHTAEKKNPGGAGIYCEKHGIPMYPDHENTTMRCTDCQLERIEKSRKALENDPRYD